jgi:hypothetical protein
MLGKEKKRENLMEVRIDASVRQDTCGHGELRLTETFVLRGRTFEGAAQIIARFNALAEQIQGEEKEGC